MSQPTLFCAQQSEESFLTDEKLQHHLLSFLDAMGPRDDVLIIPPDYTRLHSQAGKITRLITEYYNFVPNDPSTIMKKNSLYQPNIEILPALGTHAPMTQTQIKTMYGSELASKIPSPFTVHDWRKDVETIGYVPSAMVQAATHGLLDQEWPAQLNKRVWSRRYKNCQHRPLKPLILSVGQVVPHEVMGMANFNKNLFVGVGGVQAINLSHFIGAVHGMERMMGKADNPLRSILNYASENFLEHELDLWYILTVIGRNPYTNQLGINGLYIGRNIECYTLACDLSLKVNFTILKSAPKRIVVYLDEDEFHSTWLGNKAIYRTRMAIADEGELIILAPGVRRFGEDEEIDRLIRTFGYKGTHFIMESMKDSPELQRNLSAAAHLIHGSSEGRFRIVYGPGHLSKDEMENVGFEYQELDSLLNRFDVKTLRDGWNVEVSQNGSLEEFYFISNPALGLWSVAGR